MWLKSKFCRVLLALITLLIIAYFSMRDNIRVVIPGQFYRSAQLSPRVLGRFIREKKIRSIINLRGYNPTLDWYQKEIDVSKKNYIKHYDVALSSRKLPSTALLRKLVKFLQIAPRPVLLHCESGSDRTGLASAIVLILNQNTPIKEAAKQFSWVYYVTSSQSVGKQVFPYYQRWLAVHKLQSNKKNFLRWVGSPHPL